MKKAGFTLLLLFVIAANVSAQAQTVPEREADKWIGFSQGEDEIASHKFVNNDTQILLIGNRFLQLHDVETGERIYSVEHSIPKFTKGGFFSRYILLGLPQLFNWRPDIVEPGGKWIVTLERVGTRKIRSAVARNISDAKIIAVMEFPDVAIDYVSFDETKHVIMTIGKTENKTIIANWNAADFKLRSSVSVDDYKWHQFINDGEKAIIGSGDTRFNLSFPKHGETLTLLDIGTGKVEKNFSAQNLKPRTPFSETVISSDEKFILSRRDDRYFVWDINGDGSVKYELSAPDKTQHFKLVSLAGGRYPIFRNGKKLVAFDVQKSDKPLYVFGSTNPQDTAELRDASEDGEIIAVSDDTSVSMLKTNGDGKPFFRIETDSPHERFFPVTILKDHQLLAFGRANRKEKKEFRTELYDMNGKLTNTIGIIVTGSSKSSPDFKSIFSEWTTGGTEVWNVTDRKRFYIPLETHTESSTDSEGTTTTGNTYNVEHTAISPNFDKIIKYGYNLTVLYDVASGKEISVLFEKANAKYDKSSKLKKSGLGNAGWIAGGTYVYAVSSDRDSIGFWKIAP